METAFACCQHEKEVMLMGITKKNRGICSTCVHLEKCAYRAGTDQPIWFCEAFDDTIAIETQTKPVSPEKFSKLTYSNGYLGLCVNCDHREYCMNAKQAGGVWHCEEYA